MPDADVRDELESAEHIQIRRGDDGTFRAAALIDGRWIGAKKAKTSIGGALDALRARIIQASGGRV